MARRAADMQAAAELGERLTAFHDGAGAPSFDTMAKTIWKQYDYDVSGEQLREMHRGSRDPHGVAAEVLLALIRYYGVTPESLGPVVAARFKVVSVLSGPSDMGARSFPCSHVHAEQLTLGDVLAAA